MKQEWLMPGAVVPVDMETTAALVAELKRLKTEQEPVAWLVQYPNKHEFVWGERPQWIAGAIGIEPLYTTPRQWKELTNEEIEQMMDYWSEDARSAYGGAHRANGEYVYIPDIIRDAEKRLKEKNT